MMRRRKGRRIITITVIKNNKSAEHSWSIHYVPNTVPSILQILVHWTLQQYDKYHRLHFTDEENEAREVGWLARFLPARVCVLTGSWLQACAGLASGSSLALSSLTLHGCGSCPGFHSSHLCSLSGRIWQQLRHDIRSCLMSKLLLLAQQG